MISVGLYFRLAISAAFFIELGTFDDAVVSAALF